MEREKEKDAAKDLTMTSPEYLAGLTCIDRIVSDPVSYLNKNISFAGLGDEAQKETGGLGHPIGEVSISQQSSSSTRLSSPTLTFGPQDVPQPQGEGLLPLVELQQEEPLPQSVVPMKRTLDMVKHEMELLKSGWSTTGLHPHPSVPTLALGTCGIANMESYTIAGGVIPPLGGPSPSRHGVKEVQRQLLEWICCTGRGIQDELVMGSLLI